ncbi:hypothetical protein HanXRQr2_Chr14g0637791 [Helianthus annuus]|uniref:Uncharacterized protein n=1 Tax=Helianthus annuus TaxID=4232 RepID=A0A251SG42_HELAN|nr:hypothetical protein HanXRQr2_Chr14g0637791 [Helianthus annuus]KAJ0839854.1 hypothetical protein HanPSC8_Chr14g0611731 [Helianthus annuus]
MKSINTPIHLLQLTPLNLISSLKVEVSTSYLRVIGSKLPFLDPLVSFDSVIHLALLGCCSRHLSTLKK